MFLTLTTLAKLSSGKRSDQIPTIIYDPLSVALRYTSMEKADVK